jgi:hypothetical protein
MPAAQALLSSVLTCIVLIGSMSAHESWATRRSGSDKCVMAVMPEHSTGAVRDHRPACARGVKAMRLFTARDETEPGCEADEEEHVQPVRPPAHLCGTLGWVGGSPAIVFSLAGAGLTPSARSLFLLCGRLNC